MILLLATFNNEERLTVIFEGEDPIEGESNREVWVNTLQHFGIENAFNCKPQNKNYDVITDFSRSDIQDEAEIDGYYVWCSINTKAKTKIIRQIAKELDVQVEVYIGDVNDNESKHMHLRGVRFFDGTSYEDDQMTKSEIFVNALQKIGLDKAEEVLNTDPLPFHRVNCPIVSKKQYNAVLNSKRHKYQQVDGYYIINTIKDDTKINILKLMNETYNLGLEIIYE